MDDTLWGDDGRRTGSTRRQLLARAGGGAALLSLPALLAACGDAADTPEASGTPARGTSAQIDHLTWALSSSIPSLDIATGRVIPGMAVMSLGLEGLVTVGDDRKVKPLLAESWSQPDPRTYVYRLRDGVRFWDGSPLTTDDVVYSLRRHMDPKLGSQIGNLWADAASVAATGEREVTVVLRRPSPTFAYVPALSYIVPKAFAEKLGRKLGTPGPSVNAMGTGAFRFTAFSADKGVEVERNEDYWGELPRVRRASIRFISNPQTLLLALRAGDVDGTFDISPDRARDYDRLPRMDVQWVPGAVTAFLSLDVAAPPWDDVHTRRMLAYAADRDGYIKAFLAGHGRPATSMVPPENWINIAGPKEVASVEAELATYPYDLERAKGELEQSRYAGGFKASVQFPDVNPVWGKVLVSLSESLGQIGVDLDVRAVPPTKWLSDMFAHERLGMQMTTFGTVAVDPTYHLTPFLASSGATKNGMNTANLKDPAVDRLLARQAGATGPARLSSLGDLLARTSRDLPYIPLWWGEIGAATNEQYVYEGFNASYFLSNWLAKIGVRG